MNNVALNSLNFGLKKQQVERESDLLQLSIWSIQTLWEPQKDKRFAKKMHNTKYIA